MGIYYTAHAAWGWPIVQSEDQDVGEFGESLERIERPYGYLLLGHYESLDPIPAILCVGATAHTECWDVVKLPACPRWPEQEKAADYFESLGFCIDGTQFGLWMGVSVG